MNRTYQMAVLVLGGISFASVHAEGPFRWQKGQVLTYRIEHATRSIESIGDSNSEVRTRVASLKRWQVLDVSDTGVATLQMSLAALQFENTHPDGETLTYDSANPEKSPEEVRKQFATYVNQVLAVVRVDASGKVIEVKEAKPGFGSVAKFENEPVFVCCLPAEGLKADQKWERAYQVTLEPPAGTGEKYDAVQRFACKSVADNLATVTLATEVKATPKAQEDQVPLWQNMPEGEVVFDVQAGRLHKAMVHIEKEAKTEEGSSKFTSVQTIEYVP